MGGGKNMFYVSSYYHNMQLENNMYCSRNN